MTGTNKSIFGHLSLHLYATATERKVIIIIIRSENKDIIKNNYIFIAICYDCCDKNNNRNIDKI